MKVLVMAFFLITACLSYAGEYVFDKGSGIKDLSSDFFTTNIITAEELEGLLGCKYGISENDISSPSLDRLLYELNLKWNEIVAFQFVVRRQFMNFYEDGLCLGVYSVSFKEEHSNPRRIGLYYRDKEKTGPELDIKLKELNRSIIQAVNSIIEDVASIDQSGRVMELLTQRNKEWEMISDLRLSNGRRLSETVSYCRSLDEFQLTIWELGESRSVIDNEMQDALDRGSISLESYSKLDKDLKNELCRVFAVEMDVFVERMDALQELLEKRALVLSEQVFMNLQKKEAAL